ncbi:hypothetical protein [uncultured Anaerococcus sp.]|uniref:hypothetical protein n=1 Tax=uncultured Anaerococcus sp. TaxID=293428 RepID=UPI00288A3B1E|nr:hypothetical protein [uncultured Anaerococcus sp.]
MKKIFNFFKYVIICIFRLCELAMLASTGLVAYKLLRTINFAKASPSVWILVVMSILLPFSFIYVILRDDKKILDKWERWDFLIFALICLGPYAYMKALDGLLVYVITFSFAGFIFSWSLITLYFNRFILLIIIGSSLYGMLDGNESYNIILAIVTYTTSSLDKEDVKKYLGINYFNDNKFIEDKFKAMLAIISTAFTNIIGNRLWVKVCPYLKINDGGHLTFFYRGSFRLVFSIYVYCIILIFLTKYKDKIRGRYKRKVSNFVGE